MTQLSEKRLDNVASQHVQRTAGQIVCLTQNEYEEVRGQEAKREGENRSLPGNINMA